MFAAESPHRSSSAADTNTPWRGARKPRPSHKPSNHVHPSPCRSSYSSFSPITHHQAVSQECLV